MKAVVQRVKKASVTVEGEIVGKIAQGIVILLGVGHDDSPKEVDYLVNKIINLRIFPHSQSVDNPRSNVSLLECQGEALVVSQFTLYGDCRKGRRPSYTAAAPPEMAEKLYQYFIEKLLQSGIKTASGVFGAMMEVQLNNFGPVTLLLES